MRNFIIRVAVLSLLVICTATARPALATRLDVFLTINEVTHTWELAASTDAPGGIGAIVVNLDNFGSGVSVAPRARDEDGNSRGFTVGNRVLPDLAADPSIPQYGQAFSAQYTIDIDALAYEVGYKPIPDSEFGFGSANQHMIGSAEQVPTVFFVGQYNPEDGLPRFHDIQPFLYDGVQIAGMVFLEVPPPGGYQTPVLPDEITLYPQVVGYHINVVPEPSGWLLALGFVVMLAVARVQLRRCCAI